MLLAAYLFVVSASLGFTACVAVFDIARRVRKARWEAERYSL